MLVKGAMLAFALCAASRKTRPTSVRGAGCKVKNRWVASNMPNSFSEPKPSSAIVPTQHGLRRQYHSYRGTLASFCCCATTLPRVHPGRLCRVWRWSGPSKRQICKDRRVRLTGIRVEPKVFAFCPKCVESRSVLVRDICRIRERDRRSALRKTRSRAQLRCRERRGARI